MYMKKAMWSGKLKKEDKTFDQCIRNLTTRFHFRLTDAFDHEQHNETIQRRNVQRLHNTLDRLKADANPKTRISKVERHLQHVLRSMQSSLYYSEVVEHLKKVGLKKNNVFILFTFIHLQKHIITYKKQTTINQSIKWDIVEMNKDIILEASRKQLLQLIEQERVSRRNKIIEPVVSTVTPNQPQSSSVNTNVKNKSSEQVELPEGVGTVLWYLCQLLLKSIDADIKIVIEAILSKCYDLNIPQLSDTITRYWTPPQLLKQQREAEIEQEKERQQKRVQRQQRAVRAKTKAMKKMEKQKKAFEIRHCQMIDEDAIDEQQNPNGILSSCGNGLDYACVKCPPLRPKQDQIGLIAFVTVWKSTSYFLYYNIYVYTYIYVYIYYYYYYYYYYIHTIAIECIAKLRRQSVSRYSKPE
ncbi:hypothetical protein RFI_22880 [Reticulomyxa filosa]|uniref:Uncharacterized protein n=1 Tax=Reticulomyxa filosa TaxID=46433 RepID=X6MKF3_RETFI|nr:hypothetical protein RFI_22880 [Reticulomyxa filosa]|eukprot:ETO14488.1 hypothetical protein RFI_22880 [Reticulomyxa filosa]